MNRRHFGGKTSDSRRHSTTTFKSTSVEAAETNFLKLINYSCRQKPINDDHLGQVDES